jgi:hypothetical protein
MESAGTDPKGRVQAEAAGITAPGVDRVVSHIINFCAAARSIGQPRSS